MSVLFPPNEGFTRPSLGGLRLGSGFQLPSANFQFYADPGTTAGASNPGVGAISTEVGEVQKQPPSMPAGRSSGQFIQSHAQPMSHGSAGAVESGYIGGGKETSMLPTSMDDYLKMNFFGDNDTAARKGSRSPSRKTTWDPDEQGSSGASSSSGTEDEKHLVASIDVSLGLWRAACSDVYGRGPPRRFDADLIAKYKLLMRTSLGELWPRKKCTLWDAELAAMPTVKIGSLSSVAYNSTGALVERSSVVEPSSSSLVPQEASTQPQPVVNDAVPPTRLISDVPDLFGFAGFSSSQVASAPAASAPRSPAPGSPDLLERFLRQTEHKAVPIAQEEDFSFFGVLSWAGSVAADSLLSAVNDDASRTPSVSSSSTLTKPKAVVPVAQPAFAAPQLLKKEVQIGADLDSTLISHEVARKMGEQETSKAKGTTAAAPVMSEEIAKGGEYFWIRSNVDAERGSKPSFAEKHFLITEHSDEQQQQKLFIHPEESSSSSDSALARKTSLLASLRCSVSCRKGHKEGTANHDGFGIMHLDGVYQWGPLTLIAVYDGHGKFGEITSQITSNLMMKIFLENLNSAAAAIPRDGPGFMDASSEQLAPLGKAMEDTFQTIHKIMDQLTIGYLDYSESTPLERDPLFPDAFDARESGTTATLILKGGDEDPWLLIGHIGDGKAVLVKENDDVTFLTRDHRPDEASEKERIEKLGVAHIESFYVSRGTVRPWDPRIVTTGQTWPALNMSRVFGDLHAHEQGATYMPDVRLLDAKKGEKVIVATDGVWDVFEEGKEILPYVSEASNICEEAKKRWNQKLDDGFHDDITCIVLEL
ncbi:unnamed protein product [Amoebophrya sp. A25]|nr:unnamed protein product [Amoebophrya sp. A25]|eukprot:GSA25T00008696001.1